MKESREDSTSQKARIPEAKTTGGKEPELFNGANADRLARNQAAIRLLREWMADDSGYDERVWPSLKEAIERDRLSHRKRFGD